MNTLFSSIQTLAKKLLLKCLLFAMILSFGTVAFADDSSNNPMFSSIYSLLDAFIVKYPYVKYSDTVITDTSRNQDGSKYTGGAPIGGYRLIDVRIYQPAKAPGNGSPLSVPTIPILYSSGLYAPNIPLEQSAMRFQLLRTWNNNAALPGPFPIVLMMGGGGGSTRASLKLAEDLAAAGFIVAVPSAYGSDPNACPDCSTAVARPFLHDIRAVITAAVNGQLGLNGAQVLKDSNGVAIAGCAGGSSGAAACQQAAAGATTLLASSLPGDNAADPRIRAVFSGDIYNFPSPGVNTDNFTAALGMFGSGQTENWSRDFSIYSNASQRIFYDLTNAGHGGGAAALGNNTLCDIISEYIRIYKNHINTSNDDQVSAGLSSEALPVAFEHCSSQSLSGFSVLPNFSSFAGTLAALLPKAPLSGIPLNSHNDVFNIMVRYYAVNFLRSTLLNDSLATFLAKTPIFPGLLNQIYTHSVPAIAEDDFNLQNKQIDFIPIHGTQHYKTTITTTTGPIADPSLTPGAYSLGSFLTDGTMPIITPAFNIPILNGNIPSSNSVALNPSGYISLESSASTDAAGFFAAPRASGWFADHGTWTIAVFGSVLCNSVDSNFNCLETGPGSQGQVWVSNTPQRLQITYYNIWSVEFPNVFFSAQVTLFPDGHIRMAYDNSIPIPGVLTGEFSYNGSVTVGISNGRLHVDNGGPLQSIYKSQDY